MCAPTDGEFPETSRWLCRQVWQQVAAVVGGEVEVRRRQRSTGAALPPAVPPPTTATPKGALFPRMYRHSLNFTYSSHRL